MQPSRTHPPFRFGSSFSQLGKQMLIIYAVIYIIELLFEHWFKLPLIHHLMIYPFSSERFYFWQIATHPFIHNPTAPIGFLINCLVFYFFAAPVEYAFGRRRFLTLFYVAAVGGAVCGLFFSSVSGLNAPFMGMLPSLLALVVIFGFLNPEATILLMFILPVKAKYLSYGTIVITLLTFLAKANPHGAYHLGGILFGYIYFKGPKDLFDPKMIVAKYYEWQFNRKKSRFTVIDGQKNKDDDEKPTMH